MRYRLRWCIGLFSAAVAVLMLSGCTQASGKSSGRVELVVSAAASLTDSLQKLQASYEAEHPNVKLRFNFGASGALQQQIEQGAPVDLFLSAASSNMQALVDQQLIVPNERRTILRNELVLIVPQAQSGISSLSDLEQPAVKHIAIGEPTTVPAGGYAKEALSNAKLWQTLGGKLVYGKDVRQVLTYIETGNADAGFVYKTDAMTSAKVRVVPQVDPTLYRPVEYPAGIVKATKHRKEAEQLLDYLQSKEAEGVFASYGFTPVPK